jgi:chaperonin GroES
MAKVNIKPIGANILVKPISQEAVSASGIVLPDSVSKEKPQKGEVIALGTGRKEADGKLIEFAVKVGDVVLFKKYSPDEIEFNGEEYLIMNEDAILCVIEK